MILIILYIFVFVFGLYFCLTHKSIYINEHFTNDNNNCPNLLIKRGNKYLLQNTKKTMVPGVNPIQFNNLSEYEEFINWQRSQNIRCPVLFLEYAYNTQGHPVYHISPNPPFSNSPSMPEFTPQFKNEICKSK